MMSDSPVANELEQLRHELKQTQARCRQLERQEAELRPALARSEHEKGRAHTVLSEVGVAISIQDTDFKVLYQNQAHVDVIGHHVGEYCYRAYEQRQSVCEGCPVRLAFADGRTHTALRTFTLDNATRHMEITACALKDSSGHVVEGVEFVQDCTERVCAERDLAESERKYRTFVENFAGVAYRRNLTTSTSEFFRGAVKKVTGYDEEELSQGRPPWEEVIHPDHQGMIQDAHQGLLAGADQTFEHTYQIVRADGEARWIHDLGRSSLDGADGAIHVEGTFHDVTERKNAEEKLARLATVVEQAEDAMVMTDCDGIVQFTNPAFEKASGYAHDEAVGRDVESLVRSGEHDEGFHAAMWQTLRGGNVWRGRFINRRKDGSHYRVDANISPVRDANGEVFAYVSAQRDVTNHLALEAKVQHAQKLESLGVMAGGIAHDFNNLLMGVIGNAEFALDDLRPDSPARQSIDRVVTAATRAAEFTNQLLAYSGRGQFIVEPTELNRLIEELAQLVHTAISKKAKIRYDFSEELPLIEVDRTQIRQVVMNLITNASDALGDDSGVISVATGVMHADRAYLSSTILNDDLPEGTYVRVTVSDTGSGMEEEALGKLFDPFFTTKFAGRGLGLAAVLGIVRGHRGAIRVRSAPDRGSTFEILLPCPVSSSKPLNSPEVGTRQCRGGERVLVVDDDEEVRNILEVMLESAGHTVLTARHGREAVSVFEEHVGEIRLVLLDLTMPEMNGEEVFNKIRRIDPAVRVILSSGFNEQSVADRFAVGDLSGFIQKPYRRKILLSKVAEVLKQR